MITQTLSQPAAPTEPVGLMIKELGHHDKPTKPPGGFDEVAVQRIGSSSHKSDCVAKGLLIRDEIVGSEKLKAKYRRARDCKISKGQGIRIK